MLKTEHNKNKPSKLRFYSVAGTNRIPRVNEEVRSNVNKFLGRSHGVQEFTYYRNLKNEIASLTKGRCSYCGRYTDLSIEHYRPKDGIAVNLNKPRDISKPGYFWLASDWYNLHPACTPCNGLKKREVIDIVTSTNISKVVGKGNLFPLYNSRVHAPLLISDNRREFLSVSTKNVKKEKPLLFNPSKLKPKDLFKYSVIGSRRGELMLLLPKDGISEYKRMVAITTIDLLGLNSKDHAKTRMDTYTLVSEIIENIEEISDFDDRDCLDMLAKLCSYIDDSENGSYLGMIQAFFGYKLKVIANNIDFYLGCVASEKCFLSDVTKSIDQLFDAKNYD